MNKSELDREWFKLITDGYEAKGLGEMSVSTLWTLQSIIMAEIEGRDETHAMKRHQLDTVFDIFNQSKD